MIGTLRSRVGGGSSGVVGGPPGAATLEEATNSSLKVVVRFGWRSVIGKELLQARPELNNSEAMDGGLA